MFTLINCSPKLEISNSLKFLNIVSEELNEHKIVNIYKDSIKDVLSSIDRSEVIVFALPLYVDSPPSKLLEFMDYVIDNKIEFESKHIYLIINCGFSEGEQNITALKILKNWCNKVKAVYCSSLLIGAGEVIGNYRYKFISRSAIKNIKIFAKQVSGKVRDKELITTTDYINNRIYCFFANLFWNKKAKNNGLSISDINIR